jgi:calcineurin-like phosphoesterase family protein
LLFFTSDQHYYHKRVLELIPTRKWLTLEDMNLSLIENHNSVISEEDTVIILGDFIMGPKIDSIPDILPKLQGNKHLILGNHDSGFNPEEHNSSKKINLYLENGLLSINNGYYDLVSLLKDVGEDSLAVTYRDLKINLCHFPYFDDAYFEDRYEEYKPLPCETLLLHGHTHSREPITAPNMINIGVDAWEGFPVSIEQVLSLYSTF